MRRSAFDASRDLRIADETGDGRTDPALLCSAYGCPNLWTTDAGHGRTCSAHAAVDDRSRWPEVTQRQQWEVVERARQRSSAAAVAPLLVTPANKRAILGRMGKAARAMTQRSPEGAKAWAHAMKAREDAGEPLTLVQRQAWRAALGPERAPLLPEESR